MEGLAERVREARGAHLPLLPVRNQLQQLPQMGAAALQVGFRGVVPQAAQAALPAMETLTLLDKMALRACKLNLQAGWAAALCLGRAVLYVLPVQTGFLAPVMALVAVAAALRGVVSQAALVPLV